MSMISPLPKGLDPRFSNTALRTITGTTEQSLLPSAAVGSAVIPANWFQPGANVRVVMRGIISTILTPGTATFTVKFNGTPIAASSATGLLGTMTNAGFFAALNLQCFSSGPTGTLSVGGEARYPSGLISTLGSVPINTVSPITFDSTVDNTFDFTAKMSLGGNSITVSTCTVELMTAPSA